MSINSVMNSAVSGLTASQTAMRIASTNIANVNTPGYARAQAQTAPLVLAGGGAGVDVTAVRRIADQFLQRASLQAAAQAAGAERAFGLLDRLQAQFGSMDDPGSLFGRIDASLGPLVQLGASPAAHGDRVVAAGAIQAVLDEVARLSAQTVAMRAEADARIVETVGRVNGLLADIMALNAEIQRSRVHGDSTGAENAQAQLIDELAGLIDIRVAPRTGGGVEIRTESGLMLAGLNSAAVLDYSRTGNGAHGSVYPQIMVSPGAGMPATALDPHLRAGELAALIKLRDSELPAVAAELGELGAGYADALNAAHNANAAVPAPGELSGRNTGLLAGDTLGFSGQTSIGIAAADGTLAHRIDIDFDAGTLSVDGGPAVAFAGTIGGFVATLNAEMGALGGSASFAGGRLQLTAGAGEGLAIQQPETGGADRAGRGFSHFFGLNDLVSSPRPGFFETGLSAADAHGFTVGQTMTFRVSGGTGAPSEITIAAGGVTIGDLLSQLNNPVTGLGQYASFTLDAQGALTMTPAAGAEHLNVQLVLDTTSRGTTGLSFAQMFGLGDAARAGRADMLSVRSDIMASPAKMALARPDILGAAAGDFVLGSGDGRGAEALHAALTGARMFSSAGAIGGGAMSVTDYAARLAGDVGSRAGRAERALISAQTLHIAATEKRQSLEGVNLDEELANMTMLQQSYNASARLLQAAKEMIDTLLGVI